MAIIHFVLWCIIYTTNILQQPFGTLFEEQQNVVLTYHFCLLHMIYIKCEQLKPKVPCVARLICYT